MSYFQHCVVSLSSANPHEDSQHLGSPLSRTSVDCQLEERERGVAWLRLLPPLPSPLTSEQPVVFTQIISTTAMFVRKIFSSASKNYKEMFI